MYVIVTEDQKCIVKGKSKKYLCTVEEKTRKELMTYPTEKSAKSAIMRMMPIPSEQVQAAYGADHMFRLVVMETGETSLHTT